MYLNVIEINWKQIKGEVKTQWVKLTNKDRGIITGIVDNPTHRTGNFCGPAEDDVK